MRSARPKVLQPLVGRSLLSHVAAQAARLDAAAIHVVIGHGASALRQTFVDATDWHWVTQAQQLGTGHAVAQALPSIPDDATVIVLYGDVPIVDAESLQQLKLAAAGGALAILTTTLDQPDGYGRILRGQGRQLQAIIEHKDASTEQRAIHEVNTGLLAAPAASLRRWLGAVGKNNAQGEYYLTDCLALAVAEGHLVTAITASDPLCAAGVNDRRQLAQLERVLQRRQADQLMAAGLQLLDPARFDLRGSLRFGMDCVIDINAVFEGEVTLGDGVQIGPNCSLRNCVIGNQVTIHANSVLDGAELAADCAIGPFARLRPGTRLGVGARIGNFVETKQAVVGAGSKINHLSYVGDALIGSDVNVGAGTITCNYDGVNKWQTRIEDAAFIGSNSALVAPVTIGAGATIGAGSVISRDAPPGQLSVARGRQKAVAGWQRPNKKG